MAIRFSTRRLILSTALIALGLACWPIALAIDPNDSVVLFGLCIVAIAALPMAGISVMLSRTWIDPCAVLLTAVVVGMAFFMGVIS